MKKVFCVFFLLLSGYVHGQDTLISFGINLEKFNYPFPVHYVAFHIEGETLNMAYMDLMPAIPNQKTVLLLHGKNFNGAYWEQTARSLADSGYRVIIPDQVGFGKSDKPKSMQYSFHLLSKNTKVILDTLEIKKVCVIGHSTGGMLAVRFALQYPDMIEKIILEDPLGLNDFEKNIPYKNIDDYYAEELKQDYNKLKKYQIENYYHGTWKPEYDKWVRILAGWTKDVNYPLIAMNSAKVYDMINTQPVVFELENIEAPMLLILGQLDKMGTGKDLVAEESRHNLLNDPKLEHADVSKMRIFKLALLPGVGHVPHLEAFDAFIKEVCGLIE